MGAARFCGFFLPSVMARLLEQPERFEDVRGWNVGKGGAAPSRRRSFQKLYFKNNEDPAL